MVCLLSNNNKKSFKAECEWVEEIEKVGGTLVS
jgi:hypothetical protein